MTCDMPSIVWQDERRKKLQKKIFEEIMIKNFSYLMTKLNVHIQEIQQIPSRKNSNKSLHTSLPHCQKAKIES